MKGGADHNGCVLGIVLVVVQYLPQLHLHQLQHLGVINLICLVQVHHYVLHTNLNQGIVLDDSKTSADTWKCEK